MSWLSFTVTALKFTKKQIKQIKLIPINFHAAQLMLDKTQNYGKKFNKNNAFSGWINSKWKLQISLNILFLKNSVSLILRYVCMSKKFNKYKKLLSAGFALQISQDKLFF